MEDAAEERSAAGDGATNERVAAAVRSPVSESPSEKAMLTPAPIAVASPVKNAVRGSWVARTTAKIGASVESEPSMRPLSAGWTR